MKLLEKIIAITAIVLLILISVAVVFGGMFLGLSGFFSLIGVSYESNGSLLLFVFYCFLIGIFFEIIENIMLFLLKRSNITTKEQWIWELIVRFSLTWLLIHVVNEIVHTVTLSTFAEILTTVLMVSVDTVFDKKEK